jgi:hypothetical protein
MRFLIVAVLALAQDPAPDDVALALENWDVEFKALKLGGDPQKCLDFVRSEIGWLPYAGVLRGAWGTLQARSGNALDRSLLLAELLRKKTVRFARATLGEEEARRRVAAIVARENIFKLQGIKPPDFLKREELRAGIDAETIRVKSLIGELPRIDETTQAVREAQDHWWVQLKEGGSWIDLDPSGKPPAAERTFDSIPEDLYQKVNIQLFIESREGDKLSEEEILQVSSRAELLLWSGAVLMHTRRSQGAGPLRGVGADEIIPLISIADQIWQGDAFKFAAGARKIGEPPRGGGLGNVFGSRSATTAERLRITLTAPGGAERTVERRLFDRLGVDRARGPLKDIPMHGSVPASLSEVHFLGFSSGLLNVEEYLEQVMATVETESFKDADLLEVTIGNSQMLGRTLVLLSQAHLAGTALYEPMPRVMIVSSVMAPEKQETIRIGFTVDLADDRVRSLSTDGEAKLRFGIAQGFLEDQFVQRCAELSGLQNVMADSLPSTIAAGWKLFKEPGRWVIGPEDNPRHWWEFDPATGDIRSVAHTGLHMARRNGSLTGYNHPRQDPNFKDHYRYYRNHFKNYNTREGARNSMPGRNKPEDAAHRPGQQRHIHSGGRRGASSGDPHNTYGKAQQQPPRGYRARQGYSRKKERGQAGTEYLLVVTSVASGAVWAVMEFYPDLVAQFACTVAVDACNRMLDD